MASQFPLKLFIKMKFGSVFVSHFLIMTRQQGVARVGISRPIGCVDCACGERSCGRKSTQKTKGPSHSKRKHKRDCPRCASYPATIIAHLRARGSGQKLKAELCGLKRGRENWTRTSWSVTTVRKADGKKCREDHSQTNWTLGPVRDLDG